MHFLHIKCLQKKFITLKYHHVLDKCCIVNKAVNLRTDFISVIFYEPIFKVLLIMLVYVIVASLKESNKSEIINYSLLLIF